WGALACDPDFHLALSRRGIELASATFLSWARFAHFAGGVFVAQLDGEEDARGSATWRRSPLRSVSSSPRFQWFPMRSRGCLGFRVDSSLSSYRYSLLPRVAASTPADGWRMTARSVAQILAFQKVALNLSFLRLFRVLQSWYLANDFQFFVFSLPLLVVFRDWPLLRDRLWARCGVLLAFIAASVGCRMVVVSIYDMTISTYGLAQGHDSKSARIAGDLYIQPEYRYASYGIGVLVGVLVDHWNAQKEASADLALEQGEYAALAEELEAPEEDAMTTKFASTKVICACTPRLGKYGVGFVVAMGLMVLDLMAVYQPETGHGRSFTKVENVLYLGGLRALWSGAFAFLIVGCAMGGLPLVNKMLSLPIYIPFSKLSYGVYLIHITFLDVFIYSDQYMKWYQDQLMVFYYLGILFCSYVLSALLYVLVDAPVANLEAKLLGRE
ncbi:hypothetical protein CYMTET_51153, partial [Cymbomonas tetramitiformis]